MLNIHGESCILVLVLILEKEIKILPFSMMSAVDL